MMKHIEKIQTYLINVTVLEGRHYAWPSMDSYVRVRIQNQSFKTGVRKSTDCPFYNEYFVFEFITDLQTLLDKQMSLTVIRPSKCWRRRKVLGYCTLDLATIWNQPEHLFYQKWAIMSSQTAKYSGPRGYLKITLSVVSKDTQAKLPLANPNINDEIEGNLLLPDGLTLERQRALFVFKIYKGDGISKRRIRILENLKKIDKSGLPTSLVQITFAGITVKTSVQKGTTHPVWNEQITIAELFPPLCQRVKIELKTKAASKCGRLKAVKYLSLHSIANDQEKGFLPTFGPAYVHFYKKDFFGDVYVGKVLIALHTQLQHEYLTKPKSFVRKSILPINENMLWKSEPTVLFCAILNVNAIDKRFSRRPIRFEMSIGTTRLVTIGNHAPNITDGMRPLTVDRRYYYLNFDGKYPCLNFQCHFPDLRRRFYNRNMIEKIANDLKTRLDDIEPLFQYEKGRVASLVVERKLVEALDILAVQCRKYIDIVGPNLSQAITDLDKEKANLCIREMEDIEKIAKTIYNYKTKKKSYRRTQKLYTRIALLIDHPQDCWPDILLFAIYGNKKIATRRIESEDVIFSMVDEEMGINCGKIQTICFDTPLKLKSASKAIAFCKMDLFMWIGLRRHMEFCINALPDCFKFANSIDDPTIPQHVILNDKFDFQCRAHIYQGKFTFGSDKTGLSDFYVRVILNEESATTAIIKGKLNPLWDETVIISSVTIYGTREYIKTNPPTCIVEVLDYDDIAHSDYIGRVYAKPVVKLRDDPYTRPEFPPMLKWHSIVSRKLEVGTVLLCIELLELTSDSIDKSNENSITRIPDDIKPALRGYKVDVLFWGVRQMKKLHRIPVHRPKITMDFTVAMVESESTTLKLLNFNETKQESLIRLPVEKDYVPSLAIHLHDQRSFGRQVYVANHITHLDRFLHFPLSREERDFLLTHQQKKSYDSFESQDSVILLKPKEIPVENAPTMKEIFEDTKANVKDQLKKRKKRSCNCCTCFTCCPCCPCYKKKKKQKKAPGVVKSNEKSAIVDIPPEKEDDTFTDWWTKYYMSIDKQPDSIQFTSDTSVTPVQNKKFRLKIFEEELENIQEFSYLQDTIASFQLLRGERTEDDDVDQKHIMGMFKGNVKIYPWPPPKDIEYVTTIGRSLTNGFFQNSPNNEQLCFVARVYCVRGIKIRPKDLNGQVDPFLVAIMGNQHFGDSKTYIPRQINPTFGRMFEFQGTFPTDTLVTVQVWDYDRYSCHDLIGETTIDLENRFYTKHRAHCGLAYEYTEIGATPWRDIEPPSEILDQLCQTNNIPFPKYFDTYIMIGPLMFSYNVPEGEKPKTAYTKEELALDLLHKWQELPVVGCHLVPEHVETRSLYNPHQPGLEQGKLQLWVDIFPTKDLPAPSPVDIAPRQPERFELRVVIWNTEDVLLKEDDFFLGEKKSDIYIKGWLVGLDETQCTDVHYRSLNGEGNFNWRFVFPFTYLKTENKIVVKKKELFQIVESEKKMPCKLKLQVWDNDTFSADDFLGSVTMELASMPRGAKTPQKCNLNLLKPSAPRINLFRIKRTRGWWPFEGIDDKTNEYIVAGKLEAEFHIVSGDEADVAPVGKGRNDPSALPKPKVSKSIRIKNAYSSVMSSTLEHISSIKSMVVESSSRFFSSRNK